MVVGGQRRAPPLYPLERPGTHCIGGWVDLRDGLDGCGKYLPQPEFDPRTVQPLASRYTYWAIPTLFWTLYTDGNNFNVVELEAERISIRFYQIIYFPVLRHKKITGQPLHNDMQVATVVYVRSSLFWAIRQRRLEVIYRRFGKTYRSHLIGLLDPCKWDRLVIPKRR